MGIVDDALVCPHCKIKGQVHTMVVKLKRSEPIAFGIFNLLSLGLASLVNPKARATRANCDNCHMTWYM